MKILVLENKDESNEYICPKCGEIIKLNTEKIDDIKLYINNIKDAVNGSKLIIDNAIRISSNNSVNIQLKNVNLVLNALNEDIKKINEKLNNLLNNNEIKNKNMNNYIIAEIDIKEEDINKDVRILNSHEEALRMDKSVTKDKGFNNENEIKKCEIEINGQLIPFNYLHKFESKKTYKIKYSFKDNIYKTTYMFYKCELLTNIDLSNFNTSNVTNMSSMFKGCSSLKKINLSNVNTNSVINMNFMFAKCSSLTNINLSSFNTNNVTRMRSMFYGCFSLTNIDLSSFNTNNTTDMACMFSRCSSLTNINLSNFNTQNVTDMSMMFNGCNNLKKENVKINDEESLEKINKELYYI